MAYQFSRKGCFKCGNRTLSPSYTIAPSLGLPSWSYRRRLFVGTTVMLQLPTTWTRIIGLSISSHCFSEAVLFVRRCWPHSRFVLNYLVYLAANVMSSAECPSARAQTGNQKCYVCIFYGQLLQTQHPFLELWSFRALCPHLPECYGWGIRFARTSPWTGA